MTLGGFGSSSGFKDGIRYMMKADIDKLRTALANGNCSTSRVCPVLNGKLVQHGRYQQPC